MSVFSRSIRCGTGFGCKTGLAGFGLVGPIRERSVSPNFPPIRAYEQDWEPPNRFELFGPAALQRNLALFRNDRRWRRKISRTASIPVTCVNSGRKFPIVPVEKVPTRKLAAADQREAPR